MKFVKIELSNGIYRVKEVDGDYLSTIHSVFGVVPYEWDAKQITRAELRQKLKDIWSFVVLEDYKFRLCIDDGTIYETNDIRNIVHIMHNEYYNRDSYATIVNTLGTKGIYSTPSLELKYNR